MNQRQQEFSNSSHLNETTRSNFHHTQKPIEMYVFLDPFSLDSLNLQSYLKKLTMEYGRFFTLRPIVSGTYCVTSDNNRLTPKENSRVSCIFKNKRHFPVDQPFPAYFAIKAAELQGKKAGNKFLRKVQEKILLKMMDFSSEDILFQCAYETDLDLEEFERDFNSITAKKAYQCDRRLTKEMDVDTLPTIVFFDQLSDGHGMKVSGIYPYEVYEHILSRILSYQPIPSVKLSLKEFIQEQSIVSTEEISIVYDWSIATAEREMKKLQIKQEVQKYKTDYGTYWKALY